MEERRICAFIDALGTSNIFLGENSDKRINMLKLIKRISDRNASQSFNHESLGFALIGRPTPQITTFSDNIALSCTYNDISSTIRIGNDVKTIKEISATYFQAMVTQIISIVWEALRYGIIFRGGICLGDLVHNDEIIAGDALVKAVILEKQTKEARIEVQKEIMTLNDNLGNPLIDDFMKEYCFEEVDGRWFLKIFGYHELIFHDHNYFMEKEGLSRQTDKREILKYYSEQIAKEYNCIINSNEEKVIKKWNWFLDDIERAFVTSKEWSRNSDYFDSMFGTILKETQWTRKMGDQI